MTLLRSMLAATLLALLGAGQGAVAATLSLEPALQTASTGDSISVDLVISGLGDFAPSSLGDFDIDVGFDPSTLSLTGFSLGPFLGNIGLGEALDLSLGEIVPGLVNVLEVSLLDADASSGPSGIPPFLDDIQPGTFSLATFNFDVLNLGPGELTTVGIAGVFALGDGFGLPLTLDATSPAVIEGLDTAQVPAPQTALLVLAGLVCLALSKGKSLGTRLAP